MSGYLEHKHSIKQLNVFILSTKDDLAITKNKTLESKGYTNLRKITFLSVFNPRSPAWGMFFSH